MRYAYVLLLLAGCWRLEVEDDAQPPDAKVSVSHACDACSPDQQCVQYFVVSCGDAGVRCLPKVEGCAPGSSACSAECQVAYCTMDDPHSPWGCMYGSECAADPRAFVCNGI